MTHVDANITSQSHHPIDAVEQALFSREWPHERIADDEIVAEINTHWCDVRLWCSWRPEVGALLFSLSFGSKVQMAVRPRLYNLLALVNQRMWLGHFDLCHEEGFISYRHTLLAAQEGMGAAVLDQFLDVAFEECERFYPAFQSVMWGGKTPEEALEIAMFETLGEA